MDFFNQGAGIPELPHYGVTRVAFRKKFVLSSNIKIYYREGSHMKEGGHSYQHVLE